MSKLRYWLLVFLAAAPAMARDIPKNWLEVRSPHFTVVTDTSEKQARRIAAQFERMRTILLESYPQLESDQEIATVVLAVQAKKEFRALEPKTYLSKGALKLHGLFVRGSEKNYILMRLDAEGGNPYRLVYHEYTHLLLSEVVDSIPLWLDEGLAEFYQNTQIYDREVLLGEPNQQHLLRLREEKPIPLPTLFTIDAKSPYYLEEKKAAVFYAESWALTHYLTLKDYQDRTSRVQQYTELVSEGVDPVTAGTRVFGDLKRLQKALNAYVEQPTYNRFQTNAVAKVDGSKFLLQPLNRTQAGAVEADFLAGSGRMDEARNRLLQARQFDPQNASVPGAFRSRSSIPPARTDTIDADLRPAPTLTRSEDRPVAGRDPGSESPPPHDDVRNDAIGLVVAGPRRFLVGVLKDVSCEPPTLELTVHSGAKTLRLHAQNYYKIEFTALFHPTGDLEPCRELENRPAKVQYVESPDGSGLPYLIAVELHK